MRWLLALALVVPAAVAQPPAEPYVLVAGSFRAVDAERYEVRAVVESSDVDEVDLTLVVGGTRVLEERVWVADELNRTTEEVRGAKRRVVLGPHDRAEVQWWVAAPQGFWSARFLVGDSPVGRGETRAWRDSALLLGPGVTMRAGARLVEPDLTRVEVAFEPVDAWARDAAIAAWVQPAGEPALRVATDRPLDAPLALDLEMKDGARRIVVAESSADAVAGDGSWRLAVRTRGFVFERHGEDVRIVEEYDADARTGLRHRGFEEGSPVPGAPAALVVAALAALALARRRR